MKSPTRRDLLKVTLIGGAAAATGAIALPRPAAADGGYQVPIGDLTLGAILRTYVSPPLGASGVSNWSFSTQRTDSFGLKQSGGSTLAVSRDRPDLPIGPITIGGGSTSVTYGRSTQQSLNVAYRVTSSVTYYTAAPGSLSTADDAVFVFLYRPVFRIYQDFGDDGYPTGLFRYDLIGFGGIFTRTARDLRRNTSLRAAIGAATADSLVGEYPLIEFDSAEALGLGGPRFIKYANESSTTPQDRSTQYSGTFTYSVERTSTYSVNIVSSGISSQFFSGFGTNNTFNVATSSTQELAVQNIVTFGTTGWNSHGAVNSFYEDLVYMTQVIGYEGEGLLAFSGFVTATNGRAIPGAVVTLVTGNGTTRAVADRTGYYELRTTKRLPAGKAKLNCGGVTRTVTTGSGATRVDYRDVAPKRARRADG